MSEAVKRYVIRHGCAEEDSHLLPGERAFVLAADHDRIVSELVEGGRKMQAQVEQLTKERDKAVRSEQFIEQWYAVRFRRLEDLGKARGCWDEMATIIANGTESGNDPINYAGQLNIALHRATAAELERDRLAERCRELEAKLSVKEEFYKDAIHSHVSLAQQRDTLRAEVAQARGTAEYWKAEHLAGNAEIERLQKDADLFRRLRNLPDEMLGAPGVPCVAVPDGPRAGRYVSGTDLDAALEASR
ncbi:hypothetical protein [Azotobacter vinelandii]